MCLVLYITITPVMLRDPIGLKATGEIISKDTYTNPLVIKILQMRLNDLGIKGSHGRSLVVSGIYDDSTQTAVTRFKLSKLIDNYDSGYGAVGDQAWKAMGLILDTDITDRLYDTVLRTVYSNIILQLPDHRIPKEPTAYVYFLFYNMVRLGGPLDLKQRPEWKSAYFIFDGKIVPFDAPGNIAFGIAGRMLNIPESILRFGAGMAQIIAGNSNPEWQNFRYFGDDPMDQLMTIIGFRYYYKRLGC